MTRRLRNWSSLLLIALLSIGFSGCKKQNDDIDQDPETEKLPPKEASRAALAVAREHDANGYESSAIEWYEKAREYDDDAEGVSYRLAVLYDRQGQNAKAREEYKKAIDEDPENSDIYCDLGYYYYQRGEYANAEHYLRESLKKNNRNKVAWINLGMTLTARKKTNDAYYAFTRAVSKAEAYCNMAMILAQHKYYKAATEALSRALKFDPQLSRARALMAHIRAMQQITPKALDPNPQRRKLPESKPSQTEEEVIIRTESTEIVIDEPILMPEEDPSMP